VQGDSRRLVRAAVAEPALDRANKLVDTFRQAHLQAPHMGEYRARVKDIVASVTLQVLEPR